MVVPCDIRGKTYTKGMPGIAITEIIDQYLVRKGLTRAGAGLPPKIMEGQQRGVKSGLVELFKPWFSEGRVQPVTQHWGTVRSEWRSLGTQRGIAGIEPK